MQFANTMRRVLLAVIKAQPGGLNITSATVAGLATGAQTLGNVVSSGDSVVASLYHYGVQGFDNVRSQYEPPSTHVR